MADTPGPGAEALAADDQLRALVHLTIVRSGVLSMQAKRSTMPQVLAAEIEQSLAPLLAEVRAEAAASERRRCVEVLRDLAAQCRDTSIRAMTREGCDEALAAAVAVDHGADLIANGAESDGGS